MINKNEISLKDFKKWQNEHPNFMTPELVLCKQKNNGLFVELSEGLDLHRNAMYGVTLVEWNENTQKFETLSNSKLNKCFTGDNALKEAKDHYKNL